MRLGYFDPVTGQEWSGPPAAVDQQQAPSWWQQLFQQLLTSGVQIYVDRQASQAAQAQLQYQQYLDQLRRGGGISTATSNVNWPALAIVGVVGLGLVMWSRQK